MNSARYVFPVLVVCAIVGSLSPATAQNHNELGGGLFSEYGIDRETKFIKFTKKNSPIPTIAELTGFIKPDDGSGSAVVAIRICGTEDVLEMRLVDLRPAGQPCSSSGPGTGPFSGMLDARQDQLVAGVDMGNVIVSHSGAERSDITFEYIADPSSIELIETKDGPVIKYIAVTTADLVRYLAVTSADAIPSADGGVAIIFEGDEIPEQQVEPEP